MTIEKIQSNLKKGLDQEKNYNSQNGSIKAAVLLPLFKKYDEWHLLFIRRTETVNTHKGQVAFPGGGMEVMDQNLWETALRETQEEIGIKPERINFLGKMNCFDTISKYIVFPFIGLIPEPKELILSKAEVDRAFSIPLKWLANHMNYEIQKKNIPNYGLREVIYYQLYDGELLWGLTARITLDFLSTLQLI
ncbi:MAG: CoA pyrophosphatase [Anaerolineaceae bacterium]|nr:CoA pyrophosphatase [Anaerolineaceae bacterium]